jgi:hypothetical protein
MIEPIEPVKTVNMDETVTTDGGAMNGQGPRSSGRHSLGALVALLLFAAILGSVVVVRALLPTQQPLPAPETPGTTTTLAAGSGVHGTVTLREGNCQPGVVGETRAIPCDVHPVSRRVYIYSPPVGDNEVDGAYYRGGRDPKAIVHSDGQGNYAIDLPTGSYSIMVEDDGRHYCNSLSRGRACAVTIRAGEHARRDLEIDHGSF